MADMTDLQGHNSASTPSAWVTQVPSDQGVLHFELGGELDISSAAAIRDVITTLLEQNPSKVVFDVRRLHFIDSSGIAVLLTAARECSTVEIAHPSPIVRRIIEVSGLSGVLLLTS